jgi:hypothetical protein
MTPNDVRLQYGQELIYFPRAGHGLPRRVWFVSLQQGGITMAFGNGAAFVTDEPIARSVCAGLAEVVALQSQDFARFRSLGVYGIESTTFLHSYTERKLKKIKKACGFLSNRQSFFSRSRQLCLLPGMAVLELGSSSYYHRVRKWPRLIRSRFILNSAITLIFGAVKLPLAILIFFYDILQVAFAQYGEYRGSISKYASARKRQNMMRAFRSPADDTKLTEEVDAAKKAMQSARGSYTKHNLTLFTLLISIAAGIVSGYFALQRINGLGQQLEIVQTQLASTKLAALAKDFEITNLTTEVHTLQAINASLSMVPEVARAILNAEKSGTQSTK